MLQMRIFLEKIWLTVLSGLVALTAVICLVFNNLLPLYFVVGAAIIIVVLWRPLVGFCLMTFLIPLEDLTVLFPSLTFAKAIGVITFWSYLMQLITRKKVIKVNSFFLTLILYILWCLLSYTWAIQPEQSWLRVVSLIQLLFMFFLGYNLVEQRKDFFFVAGSYLIGAFLAGCLGVYNACLHEFTTRAVMTNLQNPNYYARVIGIGLIFCGYFTFVFKNWALKISCLIMGAIIFFALLLSGSRGAWLALFCTIIAAAVFCGRRLLDSSKIRKVKISFVVAALFILVLIPVFVKYLPPVVIQRAQTLSSLKDERGAGRLDIWLVGLQIVRHNLLSGVGIENFPYAYTKYFPQTEGIVREIGLNKNPHNIYLATLAELGIPGFMVFIYLLFSMWKLSERSANPLESVLSKLIVIFLVIAGLTGEDHFRKFFWFGMLVPSLLAQFSLYTTQSKEEKIKVMFISPIFPNRLQSNYGIFSLRIVQNLISAGATVYVAAPVPYAPPFIWLKKKWRAIGLIPWRERLEGVEIIHPRYLCLPGGKVDKINMLLMFWAVYPLANSLYLSNSYKLIHSYGITPAGFVGQLIAERLKLRSVCTAIGADININANKSEKMFALTRSVLANASKVVAVGKDLAEKAANISGMKNIKVIYNGVNTDMFNSVSMNKVQAKQKIGINLENSLLLFVGRIIRQKGVYELMAAFEKVCLKFPEAFLAFVGEGEDKDALIEYAAQKGIREKILFTGTIPHSELNWWYAASEMVLVLSLHDGVPNVVKEAMICARPVIATRAGGIPELLQDGQAGFLVEPGQVEETAQVIEKLLEQPDLAARMGQKARDLIQERQLSWQNTADAYLQLYMELTQTDIE